MKSMSDDIVSAARVEALEKSHADLAASYQSTLKKIRNWMFGLAAANLVIAVVLVVIFH